jgi:catechol 2,3-dioxygenase-like lactoylglutathione lyase family enzyme
MQIKELKIYSSNIKAQTDFYNKILGLNIINYTDKNVSLAFGKSILNIEYKTKTTPYHFAINIPANKEFEALDWLKSKVEILKDGNIEIQDFDFWNAKAIYFYDIDENIVELIARKNLNNLSNKKFNANQFLEISEIGLPTLDIQREFVQLTSLTGIEIFYGGFERFCAIGDENGLFICVNKGVKDWFPTNDNAYSSEFEIKLIEKGNEYRIEYKNERIKPCS